MAIYDVSTNEKKASPSLVAGGTLYADSPLGTILPFGGSSIPSGWLLCDGTAVSRTTYSELFAVIGESFGAGDGSTTFNLPDMRETVPVGSGTRGSGVADHDIYTVGQFKDDQLQDHRHTVTPIVTMAAGDYSTSFTDDTPEGAGGLVTVGRHGTTTHGKQLGVNYIIKAKMVVMPSDFMSKVGEVINENATSPVSANDKLMVADSLLNYHSIGDNGYDFTAMTTAPLGRHTQFFTNWNDSTNFPAVYGSGIYIPAKDASCATIIYSTSNGNTYVRYRNSGTWTSWQKLVTESDIPKYETLSVTLEASSSVSPYTHYAVVNLTASTVNKVVSIVVSGTSLDRAYAVWSDGYDHKLIYVYGMQETTVKLVVGYM